MNRLKGWNKTDTAIQSQEDTDMKSDTWKQNEKGMMVVETTISFTIFMMVVFCFVYLISIFTVHNRIQFAINAAAHEIASYSYLYTASGLGHAEDTLNKDGAPYMSAIDNTTAKVVESYQKISSLYERGSFSYEEVASAGQSVYDAAGGVGHLVTNPNELLAGGIYMMEDKLAYDAKSAAAASLASAFTEKYLSAGNTSSDNLLSGYKIIGGMQGMDFSDSTMMCDSEYRCLIDIVVRYDIDMEIVKLLIPDAKIKITQRVTVPAWLDGDGKTLKDYR